MTKVFKLLDKSDEEEQAKIEYVFVPPENAPEDACGIRKKE